MKKDDAVNIPDSMRVFKIGLGWDTNLDLDCSVLLFDRNGEIFDNICFSNLRSEDGAVEHSGDNLTGEGKGDDEVITVNLDNISHQVGSIWPVITIYSNGQFDDVKGAYCRVFANCSGKPEFARFTLSKNMDNMSNGCIMGSFTRTGNGSAWLFKARGYYTRNTSMSTRILPVVK